MAKQFRVRPRELARLREAIGYGMANLGNAIEDRAKANAPVRGGNRSFAPGGPVGGTLRRSIHSVAYVDGRPVGATSTDENGGAIPSYPAGNGISVFVGTNSGYGGYVHEGTSRMPGRPFLTEAFLETQGEAAALITAGARRKLGQ